MEVIVKQSGTAQAGRFYIGTTHQAIQNAVEYLNLIGGGKVFIEKGVYDIQTPISLYSDIEICGEGIGTQLKPSFANTGDNAVLSCVGTSGNELENIYVHDLTIGGDTAAVGRYGIYCSYVGKGNSTGLTSGDYSRYDSSTVGSDVSNKYGIRIEDCIIRYSNSGIYLSYSSNNTVTGNTIQNNSNNGIRLSTSSNNTVTGNTIQNNGSYGIYLSSSSNNTVTGNTIQNNGSDGINLSYSSNNSISGNTIQNNNNSGIYLSSSYNNTVIGNTIQNNGSGIYLYTSNNNTVLSNTVQNNNGYGVILHFSSNAISGNTIQNNNSYGIYIKYSNNNSISGNISTNNTLVGVSLETGSDNIITGNNYNSISNTGTNNIIEHNVQIV